jgi:hypothetical protein
MNCITNKKRVKIDSIVVIKLGATQLAIDPGNKRIFSLHLKTRITHVIILIPLAIHLK